MPRGGARPGAGRKPDPEKAAKRAAKKPKAGDKPAPAGGSRADWPFGPDAALIAEEERKKAEALADLTPLDYMLQVMRDPAASVSARMQAAIQAAPYMHGKVAPAGKKTERADKAKEVGAAGTFRTRAAPGLKVVGSGNG